MDVRGANWQQQTCVMQRSRYLNAQRTFNELLDMGVIPIVNENDTLAVSEIKFGDNDTLSAITAAMVHADLLFLMTDVDCLYDKNPRSNPDAQPIEVVEDIGALQADGEVASLSLSLSLPACLQDLEKCHKRRTDTALLHQKVSSAGSALGTGGMSTKIVAARLATSAGVTTVITRASNPGNITQIAHYIQANRSPPTGGAAFKEQHHHDTTTTADDEALASSTASLDLTARNEQQQQQQQQATATATATAAATVPLHTRFLPSPAPIGDRSFWILHGLKPHGALYIDAGCYKALLNKAGLLPAGVVDVDGGFAGHECVRLLVVERERSHDAADAVAAEGCGIGIGSGSGSGSGRRLWHGEPQDVGRAIVNYSSVEISRIMGHQSKEIEGLLGYADSGYVAEREHVSFFRRESRPQTPTLPVALGAGTPVVDGVAEYESKA